MQFTQPALLAAWLKSAPGWDLSLENRFFNPVPCGKYGLCVVLHLVLVNLGYIYDPFKKKGDVLCHGRRIEIGRSQGCIYLFEILA